MGAVAVPRFLSPHHSRDPEIDWISHLRAGGLIDSSSHAWCTLCGWLNTCCVYSTLLERVRHDERMGRSVPFAFP